jgi:hypothetical protein
MIRSPQQQIERLIPAHRRLHAPPTTVNRGRGNFSGWN